MKNRWLILFLLAFLWLPAPADAAEPPVALNGAATRFVGMIQEDRTLIPAQFFQEALGGSLAWDPNTEELRLRYGGQELVYQMGQARMQADGREVSLEIAPQAVRGLVYLPLRSAVEALGGTVGWNSELRQADVRLGAAGAVTDQQKMDVLAYYYYPAHEELKTQGHLFTDLALRWFATNAEGDLFYEYQDDYSEVLRLADSLGLRKHASVVLMGKDSLHQLLSSATRRQKLIAALVREARQNYDGINIDFEMLNPADAGLLVQFLAELKQALPANKVLSAAVFARTETDQWPTAYDYDQIGKICDQVVVMSYDYSYPGSDPGPIAPLWWVEKVAAYMRAHIDPAKVYLGVANYGYDFVNGGKTSGVIRSTLDRLDRQYQISKGFDRVSASPHYTYWDAAGQQHDIWLEDYDSLQAKYDMIEQYGLNGLTFWRIGTGFTDIYSVLASRQ